MPHTMLPRHVLLGLVRQVDRVVGDGIPGSFVECGVWKGGSSFLMAHRLRTLGQERLVWMFDSFEGLPPPQPIDGPLAQRWASETDGPNYHDNCVVSLDQVRATADRLELGDRVRLVKGWFDETLVDYRSKIGPIALLRIDADWYASVRSCLESLYDLVSPGGLIVIDDYGVFDGCTLAVHEFLASRELAHAIWWDGSALFRKTVA